MFGVRARVVPVVVVMALALTTGIASADDAKKQALSRLQLERMESDAEAQGDCVPSVRDPQHVRVCMSGMLVELTPKTKQQLAQCVALRKRVAELERQVNELQSMAALDHGRGTDARDVGARER